MDNSFYPQSLPLDLPEFRVIRSTRRKKGIAALRQNGVIEIHIPHRMSRKDEMAIIPEMIERVLRQEASLKKGDDHLEALAAQLLEEFLPDWPERPASITWRSMRERWGSCTTATRAIRISDRLASAPRYVLAGIVFHELIHLRHADHGDAFQAALTRYPQMEKVEAWLEGFEAGAGSPKTGSYSQDFEGDTETDSSQAV